MFPNGDPVYDEAYAQEAASIDAAELIARALESSGMAASEAAVALGVKKSELNALLRGEGPLTVRELARTLYILGQRLSLSGLPSDQSS